MSDGINCCGRAKVGGYIGTIKIYSNPDKTNFWLDAEHARRSLRFNRYDMPILKKWRQAVDDAPLCYWGKLVSLEDYDWFVHYQLSALDRAMNTPFIGINLYNVRTKCQQDTKVIADTQQLIHEAIDRFKRQDNCGHEELFMKNNYDLRETKRITTPNRTTMRVFTDGVNEFVKTTEIAQALGYSAFVTNGSLLALVFKNTGFHLYTKPIYKGCKPSYLNKTTQVVPILQAFIRLTLMTRQTNSAYLVKIDDARMEAERLIPVFKREILGEPCDDEISTNDNQEATQMENNKIQTTVSVVTVIDIEDINERAEAVAKVFGVSKVDALRAATLLKAEEINRGLQPLLDLLDK